MPPRQYQLSTEQWLQWKGFLHVHECDAYNSKESDWLSEFLSLLKSLWSDPHNIVIHVIVGIVYTVDVDNFYCCLVIAIIIVLLLAVQKGRYLGDLDASSSSVLLLLLSFLNGGVGVPGAVKVHQLPVTLGNAGLRGEQEGEIGLKREGADFKWEILQEPHCDGRRSQCITDSLHCTPGAQSTVTTNCPYQ